MKPIDECKDRLRKLFDINTPIIYIQSDDVQFVDSLLADSTMSPIGGNAERIFEWNPGTTCLDFETGIMFTDDERNKRVDPFHPDESGRVPLENFLGFFLENSDDAQKIISRNNGDGVILLKNIHDKIKEPAITTCLQLIARRRLWEPGFNLTIVIVDPVLQLAPEIEHYTELLEIPFSDKEEIREIIKKHAKAAGTNENLDENDDLVSALLGLSRLEIHRTVDLTFGSLGSFGGNDDDGKKFLNNQKKQIVKKSSVLEVVDTDFELDDIGGLEYLKEYLENEREIVKSPSEALKKGIPAPKGIFILGMPGCGKSMTAKATAKTFDVPLLKMDMGGLLGKYVGDSEQNLRSALRTAEAIAPCVLWIDEIEKGFAGVSGGNGGTDVMRRLFGTFLSWMQDKTKPVYVIATANDAESLPPELKRKGRFDEIFCTLLPNQKERAEILKKQIEKKRDKISDEGGQMEIECSDDEIAALASQMEGYNGADIESVLNMTLKRHFEDDSISAEDILEVMAGTHPVGDTCKMQIEKMKTFFEKNVYIDAGSGKPTGKDPEIVKKQNDQRKKLEEKYEKAVNSEKYAEALQIREIIKTL